MHFLKKTQQKFCRIALPQSVGGQPHFPNSSFFLSVFHYQPHHPPTDNSIPPAPLEIVHIIIINLSIDQIV